MKTTKVILLAALLGAAAMSANAGVRFGFFVGLPVPVVTAAPVIVTTPVFVTAAPAPVVEVVPACPGVNYVWAPGYWSHRPTGYVYVPGAWNHHPVYAGYGYFHGGHRW